MTSEFTTLSLLVYSISLVGVFAVPTVRQRVPRLAVALLVTVPWAAALLAGALTPDNSSVPNKCDLLHRVTNESEAVLRLDANGNPCFLPYGVSSKCDDYYAGKYPQCTTSDSRQLQETVMLGYETDCRSGYVLDEITNWCPTGCRRSTNVVNGGGMHDFTSGGVWDVAPCQRDCSFYTAQNHGFELFGRVMVTPCPSGCFPSSPDSVRQNVPRGSRVTCASSPST
jgi:hypothetical protein